MLHSLLFCHRPFLHNLSEHSNRGKTDIYEQDDAYIVHTEVPGFRQEDIDVSVTGNSIEIKAEREVKTPEGFTTTDDSSNSISFHRTFRFRKSLDETSISAKVNLGLLQVHLPKKSARKIPISVQ